MQEGKERCECGLTIRTRDPRNTRDFDAVIGKGFGLFWRGFTVDGTSGHLSLVDTPRLFREHWSHVFAFALHLGTHPLEHGAHLVGEDG